MAKRPTRHDYEAPGSFGRVLEAAIACADADADDDANFAASEMRLRAALKAHAPRIIGARGGKATAERRTPEERREAARRAIRARWEKRYAAVRIQTNGAAENQPKAGSKVDPIDG